MFELVIILLCLICIGLSITTFYALRRINQYESYIAQFQQIINFASARMKIVDDSGHYESDDETGFFFDQLKQLQILLNDIFENTDGDTNAPKEK
jgi:hypothetical protein